ncbi:Soluble NSF attachment protein [Thelohanellus kitauei]|uniref:Soluble NSF attachment protein n=1 Tax=Thelohanellus kitauei TaxID=669202 RepID=A0A0C2I6K9_THEKT|nr:Soluble NSF attachment protein [Thelohanellus kitauei]
MTNIEQAVKLVEEAERLSQQTKDIFELFELVFTSYSPYGWHIKCYNNYVEAGKIYEESDELEDAANLYHKAGKIAEDLGKFKLAAMSYELARQCALKCNPGFSIDCYIKAVTLYIEDDFYDGLERCTETMSLIFELGEIDKSLAPKFYEQSIDLFVKYAYKDNVKSFVNIFKFQYARHLYLEKDYQGSLPLFKDVALAEPTNTSNDECIYISRVYTCLVAILALGPEAPKYIYKLSKRSQEFKQSSQYLIIKIILECIRNRNFEGLEEAVKSLTTKGERFELFYSRVRDNIDNIPITDPLEFE